jgi:hypothetical protein
VESRFTEQPFTQCAGTRNAKRAPFVAAVALVDEPREAIDPRSERRIIAGMDRAMLVDYLRLAEEHVESGESTSPGS